MVSRHTIHLYTRLYGDNAILIAMNPEKHRTARLRQEENRRVRKAAMRELERTAVAAAAPAVGAPPAVASKSEELPADVRPAQQQEEKKTEVVVTRSVHKRTRPDAPDEADDATVSETTTVVTTETTVTTTTTTTRTVAKRLKPADDTVAEVAAAVSSAETREREAAAERARQLRREREQDHDKERDKEPEEKKELGEGRQPHAGRDGAFMATIVARLLEHDAAFPWDKPAPDEFVAGLEADLSNMRPVHQGGGGEVRQWRYEFGRARVCAGSAMGVWDDTARCGPHGVSPENRVYRWADMAHRRMKRPDTWALVGLLILNASPDAYAKFCACVGGSTVETRADPSVAICSVDYGCAGADKENASGGVDDGFRGNMINGSSVAHVHQSGVGGGGGGNVGASTGDESDNSETDSETDTTGCLSAPRPALENAAHLVGKSAGISVAAVDAATASAPTGESKKGAGSNGGGGVIADTASSARRPGPACGKCDKPRCNNCQSRRSKEKKKSASSCADPRVSIR